MASIERPRFLSRESYLNRLRRMWVLRLAGKKPDLNDPEKFGQAMDKYLNRLSPADQAWVDSDQGVEAMQAVVQEVLGMKRFVDHPLVRARQIGAEVRKPRQLGRTRRMITDPTGRMANLVRRSKNGS